MVEGAGGWLVPLNERETLADYAVKIAGDIILVVGLKLGCINHALMTVQAIRASGAKLAGWVANHCEPAMPASGANIDTLASRINAPMLGEISYTRPLDNARIAGSLDVSCILTY